MSPKCHSARVSGSSRGGGKKREGTAVALSEEIQMGCMEEGGENIEQKETIEAGLVGICYGG